MKLCLLFLMVLALPVAAVAQAVPTTPKKFGSKAVGAATSTTGASINPTSTAPAVRHITYLTLSPLRQWTSTDGKTLMGKLIAWEESVTTGTPAPLSSQPLTTNPTILRNGKARLLINNKAFEVPLERLGLEEQKFIQQVQAGVTTKP